MRCKELSDQIISIFKKILCQLSYNLNNLKTDGKFKLLILITAKEVNKGTSVFLLLWTPCEAAHSAGLHRLLDIKDAQQAEQNNTLLKSIGFTVGST